MNALLVKICGLTSVRDAEACRDAGADLLGFIFHPASRRNAAPEMVRAVHAGKARKVGVFVEQGPDEVAALAEAAGLDFVQLHGGQDEAFCAALGAEFDPGRIVKVFWPERYAAVAELQPDLDRFAAHCSYYLFDAGTSGGGHGKSFDAGLLAGIAPARPWLLAGGLGPDNVAQALLAGPHGVDMSSGVESAPGTKDMEKVRRVIRLVRNGAPGRPADAE
ncbi:phosphoribosylanthranilate isomerase [Paucidesulfovibrio longus]|uniref:phosphoribosylanthranilate isomerase n=1 Tax=Paucidesulfovibrio longus TaxID=889 RepID=UPI0003B56345|nr:phosphoribosylanthranilate isomerase [Paucidesulfovibrio longus]